MTISLHLALIAFCFTLQGAFADINVANILLSAIELLPLEVSTPIVDVQFSENYCLLKEDVDSWAPYACPAKQAGISTSAKGFVELTCTRPTITCQSAMKHEDALSP